MRHFFMFKPDLYLQNNAAKSKSNKDELSQNNWYYLKLFTYLGTILLNTHLRGPSAESAIWGRTNLIYYEVVTK